MDPRIREHAEVIVSHSTEIGPNDAVVIDAAPAAEDLVVALHEAIADIGATALVVADRMGSRFQRAYLRNHDGEFSLPSHTMALFEEMDVYVAIRSGANATETADVDPATTSAYQRAVEPLREERLSKRWCLTQYPAPAFAQLAEMSTEGYENFVWDAINRDWAAQREHQEQLVALLDDADEVRIESGADTDISMRIDDMIPVNDSGEHNLPGGEVFTAPIPESVEGTVRFDKPLYHQGREVTDVFLRFEDGEIVEDDAAKNYEVLDGVLTTDDGARRLGELGIGMNRAIDRFTYNMLFDEKMGDTVHLAVGMAYDDCVPDDREPNESAVHVDMIVDMAEDSSITLDGEVVQRDGTFVFEDGF